MQFPVTEAEGSYWIQVAIVRCVQGGWFNQRRQHTKQSKIPVLTHIHSILYPLDDVEGIVHITLHDVKTDIIAAQVIGAVSWNGGSQENNLCWRTTKSLKAPYSFWD